MASRSLIDLRPATRARVLDFQNRVGAAGLVILVTCTLRTAGEQAALYALGRTAPGRVVTWAKPGQSLHETGQAVDVVPMRAGACVWGTTGVDLALWHAVGACGEAAGLEWGGRWPARIRDYPHFQFSRDEA